MNKREAHWVNPSRLMQSGTIWVSAAKHKWLDFLNRCAIELCSNAQFGLN